MDDCDIVSTTRIKFHSYQGQRDRTAGVSRLNNVFTKGVTKGEGVRTVRDYLQSGDPLIKA